MATERNLPAEARPGWEASLRLELAARGPRTVIARRASAGPLVVQRPFYPEGDLSHIYLVHPPGGVVGGDRLELNVHAKPGARALITTPAATKFYRSEGRFAVQVQEIRADSASIEWLPQETLIFPDAHARIATRVHLAGRSQFVGWEIACYGRPASGLAFGHGVVAQDFELWLDDVPRVLDHLRLHGAGPSMQEAFGLAGKPVLGTLLAYPAEESLLEQARAVVSDGEVHTACTRVDGVLVCRAVAAQADALRRLFIAIWAQVRPAVIGRPAAPPRIWAT